METLAQMRARHEAEILNHPDNIPVQIKNKLRPTFGPLGYVAQDPLWGWRSMTKPGVMSLVDAINYVRGLELKKTQFAVFVDRYTVIAPIGNLLPTPRDMRVSVDFVLETTNSSARNQSSILKVAFDCGACLLPNTEPVRVVLNIDVVLPVRLRNRIINPSKPVNWENDQNADMTKLSEWVVRYRSSPKLMFCYGFNDPHDLGVFA